MKEGVCTCPQCLMEGAIALADHSHFSDADAKRLCAVTEVIGKALDGLTISDLLVVLGSVVNGVALVHCAEMPAVLPLALSIVTERMLRLDLNPSGVTH